MARDDMSPKMRRFLANPPKRISPDEVRKRRTKSLRRSVHRISLLKDARKAQGNRCYFCKRLMLTKPTAVPETLGLVATLDHLQPLSKGGDNSRENLAAACKRCNQEKGDREVSEYLAIWAGRHEEARLAKLCDEALLAEISRARDERRHGEDSRSEAEGVARQPGAGTARAHPQHPQPEQS